MQVEAEQYSRLNIEEFADLLQASSNLPAVAIEALSNFAGIGVFQLYIPTGEMILNRAATKLTGYEPGEIPRTENTKLSLTYEEDHELVNTAMGSLISGEAGRYYIEYRMKRKDGTTMSIGESALVLERDEDGIPIRICALCQDLTRLRQTEEKARRMDKENRVLAKSVGFKDITDRNRILRAAIAAATTVIGGFHQDYETVLRMALQMLSESIDADSAFILRNTIYDDKMCFFPRVLWNKESVIALEENTTPIDYDDLYPEWQNDFDEEFSIISSLEDLPPALRDYPLMSGAITVMLVPLYLHGEFFGMMVFKDCNKGHFFTEDEADILRIGSLPIAASITRNEIFKKVSKDNDVAMAGTIVNVVPDLSANGKSGPSAATPNWNGRTILLAEDIGLTREIIIGMLKDTGVEIISAVDGYEALNFYRSAPEKIDLILMDIQMPNIDGIAATRFIRELEAPESKKVPILALTANAFFEDVEACLSSGMNAHIAKPIDVRALIRTVDQYLSAL